MSRIELLGVPIDRVTFAETLEWLQSFLKEEGCQRHVVTPNSEMLVKSMRDPHFRHILHHTSLNLPDSMGLLWMARLTGQRFPERVAGVDIVEKLCLQLDERTPVFLLGGRNNAARRAAHVLRERNPRLNVVEVYEGSPDPQEGREIIQRINDAKPHLLLVAYGAPEQDLWIEKYLSEMPSVRVAMGVGGTFDFIAGIQKRAPVFLQRMGLEWLWRFIHEPKRFKRIWNAAVVFPLLVLRYGKHGPATP
ncbi:WecB/TagA/CpsF family glycosyltransferase [Candidatus Peregrinibacteria bacterium]|nr:WecB/TagA/CpsF family glycosyltransferase [Candidatus Peregrinibacteria bacterium]